MKNMKPLYLDFEYNNSNNRDKNILCCAVKIDGADIDVYRLDDAEKRADFAHMLAGLIEDHSIVAYSEAEAGCVYQLFEEIDVDFLGLLKDEAIRFIDLKLEYMHLLNHNHELAYGKQLIKGVEKTTVPPKPKWKIRTEWDHKQKENSKPEVSLAAACYKMLGVRIDLDVKHDTRDLILSKDTFTDEEWERILSYCKSDVVHMPALHKKISNYLFKKIGAKLCDVDRIRAEVYARGEYSARTAVMARNGYPYRHSSLKKFSDKVPDIIYKEKTQLNENFPEVKPFAWDKKKKVYVRKDKLIRLWVQQNHSKEELSEWLKTKGSQLSLSREAFENLYKEDSHSFGGAFYKYLKLESDLNGFKPPNSTKRKTFWDSIGDDSRARPYFKIYGSQSARSQPSSVSFIPLKAKWMRVFIDPLPGHAICTIDYSSQEFLLSALLSGDEEMLKAYESGDPYLYFAKLDGAIPHDGTKESHARERDIYKTATLGIGYLMGAASLAKHISKRLGKEYSEDEAQHLIDTFNEAFCDFHEWQNELINDYSDAGRRAKIRIPCGWYMWGDNDNKRSVGNFPMQGTGSSIMRKAVALAQDAGLNVIYTLHDALAVEYPSACIEHTVETLRDAMDKAFRWYFKEPMKSRATCRMDVFCWSPDYKHLSEKKAQEFLSRGWDVCEKCLDNKGLDGYNKFKEFLDF